MLCFPNKWNERKKAMGSGFQVTRPALGKPWSLEFMCVLQFVVSNCCVLKSSFLF